MHQSTILIIDDSPDSVALLEKILRSEGYETIHFTNDPGQAITQFEQLQPDLVLLDLIMPEIDGFEVLDRLKTAFPLLTYLPVIVLTGEMSAEARQRALSLGAKDFITKPFERVELTLRIHNILLTNILMKQLASQNDWLENEIKNRTKVIENQNKKLSETLRKLESSDQLKTYLMQNISHELRTPLNGILGFIDLLADEKALPEERKMYAAMVRSSAARLNTTVTNYMDAAFLASKNVTPDKGEFYLSHLLREEIRHQEEQKKKGYTKVSLGPLEGMKEVKVFSDARLIRKAFAAILDNAIKFGNSKPVQVSYYTDDQELAIEVVDQGIGIKAQDQEKVFDLFLQLDNANTRSYDGSGLGLSVVHGIVNLLGGAVKIISDEGKGTTVLLRMPQMK